MDPPAALPTPPTTPVKTPPPTTTTTTRDKAFVVRPSPTGGMGAFATRALVKNKVLLEEAPLFLAEQRSDIFAAFARMSRKKQKKAMKLHASAHFKPGTPWLEAVWDTNSFATGENREAGLFPIAARFNHACEPRNNVDFAWDADRGRLRLWVGVEGIEEGGGAQGVLWADEDAGAAVQVVRVPVRVWCLRRAERSRGGQFLGQMVNFGYKPFQESGA